MRFYGWQEKGLAAAVVAVLCSACSAIIGLSDVPTPGGGDDGSMDSSVGDAPGGDVAADSTIVPDGAPETGLGPDATDATDATPDATTRDAGDAGEFADAGEGSIISSNPCAQGNGGCSANASCTPTDGGARACMCNTGYSGDGLTCTAVNACLMNNGGCDPNATCTSSGPGTNTCACNSGYTGDGKTCTGIAACATNNGGCAATAKCTSTGPNMRTCTCNTGYSGDGMTCTPVNSCSTNNGGCSSNATCTSTGPGTNTCACNSGYTGDGMTCTLACGPSSCLGCCSNAVTCVAGTATNACGNGGNPCASCAGQSLVCNAAGNAGQCGCPAGQCAAGATQCSAGKLQTCTAGANGCTSWSAGSTCPGAHQSCPNGSSQCTCNTDAHCSGLGTVCVGSSSYASCNQDGQGCYYTSALNPCQINTTCVGGQCLLDDAQPCTSASQCANGACTTFYQDLDGDMATTNVSVSECGMTAPANYRNGPASNPPDCCDQDPLTKPGQGEYFTNPSSAATQYCPGHDPWDYNCNNNEDKEVQKNQAVDCVPNSQACSGSPPSCTCPTDFVWAGSEAVPNCGVAGDESQCANPPFSAPDGWHCPTQNDGGATIWPATQACH